MENIILYPNTEKELSFDDYKPIKGHLSGLSLVQLYKLYENLENASDNAFINHNDMLAMALGMDIRKVSLYIRIKEKKESKNRP